MGWSKAARSQERRAHDTLMSLSDSGELVFWCYDEHARPEQWLRSGRVRTGRSGYRLASCSSAKKTALGIILSVSMLILIHVDNHEHHSIFWAGWRSSINMGFERIGVFVWFGICHCLPVSIYPYYFLLGADLVKAGYSKRSRLDSNTRPTVYSCCRIHASCFDNMPTAYKLF